MSFEMNFSNVAEFDSTPVIVAVVVVVFAGLAYWGYLQEKKRREAFAALAAQLGLHYIAKDFSIASRYSFLDTLCRGDNRYAFNILTGPFQNHSVRVFDYHYETHSTDSKGNRQTHHHYFSFFILEQERSFPELKIYPETLMSRLGQMLGFDDIDFESIEFSKAFTVRSTEKRFAFDVCHTGMMTYLLAHRDLSIEIEGNCISLAFQQRLRPTEVVARLEQLIEIRNLFPEYLFKS